MDSPVKNRGRRKLFVCFRPADVDEGAMKKKRAEVPAGDQPVLTYISVGKGVKESAVIPKVLKSLSDASSGRDVVVTGSRTKPQRRLSRVLKAVFFEASLTKKLGIKRSGESSRSNGSLSIKSEKCSILTNEKTSQREFSESDGTLRTSSRSSSSLFSSSMNSTSYTSSITSSWRSLSDRRASFGSNSVEPKQVYAQGTKRGYYGSSTGLCLLVVCLLVLIFWGKICAIICTSTWLFFAPRRLNRVDRLEIVVDSPDIDSGEYKKRVIMEGLLERNRSRVL
ncbi:hypothetical protein RJ639_028202 [Escallonia herrerae]|uniref:Uncharacterized protein n=1 Tax=Escallonia herrerae TaxID=1293975 RepID=A0AA88X5I0_9ASTE|nr:hypothetical protein RJ639_028202 [Escallonia herrerae]